MKPETRWGELVNSGCWKTKWTLLICKNVELWQKHERAWKHSEQFEADVTLNWFFNTISTVLSRDFWVFSLNYDILKNMNTHNRSTHTLYCKGLMNHSVIIFRYSDWNITISHRSFFIFIREKTLMMSHSVANTHRLILFIEFELTYWNILNNTK